MDHFRRFIVFLIMAFVVIFMIVMALLSYSRPPEEALSHMERRDSKTAQEIIDSYSAGLEEVAAAAEHIAPGYRYSYTLDADASWNKEELQEMPQELADALMEMEQEFPTCKESLELQRGQIGIWLTNDRDGVSFLCYPGGELISGSVIENEKGTRCLDMGGGWELQMYYEPKG